MVPASDVKQNSIFKTQLFYQRDEILFKRSFPVNMKIGNRNMIFYPSECADSQVQPLMRVDATRIKHGKAFL